MTMSNQTIDEDGNEVEEKENVITKIVDWMVEKSLPEVDKYVGSLRSLNPEISNDALAR